MAKHNRRKVPTPAAAEQVTEEAPKPSRAPASNFGMGRGERVAMRMQGMRDQSTQSKRARIAASHKTK